MTFNPTFEEYLAEAAGENNARVALDALSGPASVSVRLNPSKADKPWDNAAGQIAGTPTSHVDWSPCGFFLPFSLKQYYLCKQYLRNVFLTSTLCADSPCSWW